jgi:HprK-related kinase B
MKDPDSIGHLIDSILLQHPTEKSLFLGIGDLIIQVQSNSAPLLDELSLYFKEFISCESGADIIVYALEAAVKAFPFSFREKEPDPGKTKIKEEYVDLADGRIVRKRLTGMAFIFNGHLNLAIGPCLENSNQVVNFINNRFIEWMLRRKSLLAHAAGICMGNRGLALAGFSGSGKSTLALHLLNRGASFISNDRLVIRKQGMAATNMYGIPKHPRVNPGTILSIDKLLNVMSERKRKAFKRLNQDELWNLEHKYDVIIHEYFGENRFHLSSPMNGLLILNWQRNGSPLVIRSVDIATRHDLLAAFIKSPGLFFMPTPGETMPDFSSEHYIDMLKGCTVIEATGGTDFNGATGFCMDFLQQENEDDSAA